MKNGNIVNFRSLCDDKYNKKGMIFRCGLFHESEDFNILRKNKIKKVFDFRNNEEIQFDLAKIKKDIDFIKLPIVGYHEKFKIINNPTPEDYSNYYIDILKCGRKSFSYILKFMAKNEGKIPIVYGCNMGKDRTGVFSYLLLKIFGASIDDIIEDYLLTGDYILNDKYFLDNINLKNINDLECRYKTKKETIMLLQNKIKNNFISCDNYLNSIGINKKIRLEINKNWRK